MLLSCDTFWSVYLANLSFVPDWPSLMTKLSNSVAVLSLPCLDLISDDEGARLLNAITVNAREEKETIYSSL